MNFGRRRGLLDPWRAALASDHTDSEGWGGAVVVRRMAELVFLGAYRATGHVVFFGKAVGGERGMASVAQLHGEANVVSLSEPLAPEVDYVWRVDAQMADGTTRRGDVLRIAIEIPNLFLNFRLKLQR